jgi:hypothetical protein
MYENDLANLNNWTGVVEDYDDPLKTGRLRVRINGFHNINKTILPTTDLPWDKPTAKSKPASNYTLSTTKKDNKSKFDDLFEKD